MFKWGGHTCWIFLLWRYGGICRDSMWDLWTVWCLVGSGGGGGFLEYIGCWILIGPCMCKCWGGMRIVLTIPELSCLGAGCVSCRHLWGCSILYVCWVGVCGLFGVQVCYVRLCKGLLCVGECMWRVGVATCPFHGLGWVCSRDWGVLLTKRCLFCGSHVLGISKFEGLCNLCIRYAWDLPKVRWEFLVKHTPIFVNIGKFIFNNCSSFSRWHLFMHVWRLRI